MNRLAYPAVCCELRFACVHVSVCRCQVQVCGCVCPRPRDRGAGRSSLPAALGSSWLWAGSGVSLTWEPGLWVAEPGFSLWLGPPGSPTRPGCPRKNSWGVPRDLPPAALCHSGAELWGGPGGQAKAPIPLDALPGHSGPRLPQSLLQLRNWTASVLCSPGDLPASGFSNQIPLVARGNCTFYEKVRLAQGSGARGLLIVSKEKLVWPLRHPVGVVTHLQGEPSCQALCPVQGSGVAGGRGGLQLSEAAPSAGSRPGPSVGGPGRARPGGGACGAARLWAGQGERRQPALLRGSASSRPALPRGS